jgi:hypothetical protein
MSTPLQRCYLVHGRHVSSAVPLAAFTRNGSGPCEAEAHPSVPQIVIEPVRFSKDANLDLLEGEPVLRSRWVEVRRHHTGSPSETRYSLAYASNNLVFWVQQSDAAFVIQPWAVSESESRLVPLLLGGNILSFVMRLLGLNALHANAVLVHDEVVAFAGPGGVGKTLSSSLALLAGAVLMSDDVTVF